MTNRAFWTFYHNTSSKLKVKYYYQTDRMMFEIILNDRNDIIMYYMILLDVSACLIMIKVNMKRHVIIEDQVIMLRIEQFC